MGQLNYALAKSILVGLTKTLARDLGRFNINVNAIAPGTTKTPMIDAISDEENSKLVSRIPLKRLGEPEDIAYATCFLASQEASYITGTTLDVNGGLLMR